jgi:hypothetical protein
MSDNFNKPKGSFAKLMSSQAHSPEPKKPAITPQQKTDEKIDNQSTDKSTNQSTNQSIDQSTRRQDVNSLNDIVDRPKAFYITKRLDKNIDTAVRYFQDVYGIKKADRSTVINALLDNEETWIAQSLDRLVDRLISQLTSRLTSR